MGEFGGEKTGGLLEVVSSCVDGGLGPVCAAGFGEDVGHVPYDGVLADEQRFGDFSIGLADCEFFEDFNFAVSEAVRMLCRVAWHVRTQTRQLVYKRPDFVLFGDLHTFADKG